MFVRDVSKLNFGKNPALFTSSQQQPVAVPKRTTKQGFTSSRADAQDEISGSSLVDLCDYLQKHQLAINLEQKMYFVINDYLKNSQTYQSKIDSILSGYMDHDLHTALINYLLVLKIDKMTSGEVELILSRVFEKNEETRALQSYIRELAEKKLLKCLQPENGSKRDESETMPNLMKMAGIHDPLNHHMSQEEFASLFKIYLRVREQSVSTQQAAFNHLKNVIFKTEKFDNRIFEDDVEELASPSGQKEGEPPLQRQLPRRMALLPTHATPAQQAKRDLAPLLANLEAADDATEIVEQLQGLHEDLQEQVVSQYLQTQHQAIRKLGEQGHSAMSEFLAREPQSHETIMKYITA